MIRPGFAFAAVLLLASCGPREHVARPALWRVSDGDTEIWLLGTIHALPPRVQWQTPAVAHAINAADVLVTEIPSADAAAFERVAYADGLPPLVARVPAGQRAAAAALGGRLDRLKSWAAAVTIGAEAAQAADASPEFGVDAELQRAFGSRGRLALETQREQLALFDALPEAAQRVLLAQALAEPGGYARTLAAWSAGDVDALATSNEAAFAAAPLLRDKLVTRRNARWSAWIARRMAVPGRVLVAVGAGHLVGPGSVVAMLRTRGLKVERVR